MGDLPKKGTWIMIIKTVPAIETFAPLFSIWYALPSGKFILGDEDRIEPHIEYDIEWPFQSMRTLKHYVKAYLKDKSLVDGDELKAVEYTLNKWDIKHQAKILTPFGTSIIQPEEYNVIDFNSYLECINNGSFQVKFMHKNKTAKNTAKDQLFYIRSRGISLSSALGMVSGIIKSQNALYMLAHPEYQKIFCEYFERYNAKQLMYRSEKISKSIDNEQYFFDMEEASKINQQYYKNDR